MDVYEKSSVAAEQNDYLEVVKQFGRAIRRAIIFDSMTSKGLDDDVLLQPTKSKFRLEPENVPINSDLKRAYVNNKELVHTVVETAHHAIVQSTKHIRPMVEHTISKLINNEANFKVPRHDTPLSPNSYAQLTEDLSVGERDRLMWSHANIYIFRSMQGLLSATFDSKNMTTCGTRLVQLNENIQDLLVYVDFDTFNYHLACMLATIGYSVYHCYYAGKESWAATAAFDATIRQTMELRNITFAEYAWYNLVWTGPDSFGKWRQLKKIVEHEITWRNMIPDLK